MNKISLLTKAARGIENGDVANAMVRNLLTRLSREFGEITEEQLEDTIRFFEGECPYTGISLEVADLNHITDAEKKYIKQHFQLDHIIPMNRNECGLNMYGNLVFVVKKANSKKGSKSYRDFIMENNEEDGLKDADEEIRKKRVDKIQEFQNQHYGKYLNMKDILKDCLNQMYDSIEQKQVERLGQIMGLVK